MIYNFDAFSFQVLTIDRYEHKQGVFEVKARPYAALSFRVSGKGDFEVGGRRLAVRPGNVMFIPADMPYRVEYSVSESIVVHLQDCNYAEAENLHVENPAAVAALFSRLLEEWRSRQSAHRVKAVIYELLARLQEESRVAGNAALQDCLCYIESHAFDPAMTVEAVCEAGFLSRSSLQRAFRDSLGISPKQYLMKLRMDRALTMLIANEKSVKEIALACGFPDEKYFSRAFKKKYGHPPSHIAGNLV
ncbi:MAG: AraC family transcriptional regulator [Clostridia bacterium]|nr:AraC family transcriptional regulator [Clostridia bacterium]